jgi:2-oxo-4-hydroxy-4-carboxy--5-ureidoimidazoline (OHCU) decarboxylase
MDDSEFLAYSESAVMFRRATWRRQDAYAQNVAAGAFAEIPEAKIRQFAAEARSPDLISLNDMPERKRLTLAGALILKQVARALSGRDQQKRGLQQIRSVGVFRW